MGREQIIASGNLLARRTIAGVLTTFDEQNVSRRRAVEMLKEAGLPVRAYDAPDFPISVEQHLQLSLSLLKHREQAVAALSQAFANLDRFDIGRFGVIGLAMQHAPSFADAMRAGLDHPELVWGHTRIAVIRSAEATRLEFTMQRPALPNASSRDIDALVAYGTLMDLISVVCMTADILGGDRWPDRIELPHAEPDDWDPAVSPPAARVRFNAARAALFYPAHMPSEVPVKANRISHLAYLKTARKLSETLVDDVGLSELVARWLWASSPPLKRCEVAELIGLSERSLARKLQAEGTSYNRLVSDVQAERAKNLLRDPQTTAASVAYRLGYSDPAAFSRAFAGWTGLAPGAWRTALSKNGDGDLRLG